MERKLIVDYLDDDNWNEKGFDEIILDIKERCGLNTEYTLCKVQNELSYSKAVCLNVTCDLYEFLNDLIQCHDCKNGCQMYEDETGIPYFCITGSNYYDRETNKYKGTDEVHVYFKNVDWEKL